MRLLSLLFLLLFSLPAAAQGDHAIYVRTVELISDHYLRLEEFDAGAAVQEAAEAAEAAIPWLIAETGAGGEIVLRHGEKGEFARLRLGVADIDDVPAALIRLEEAILAGPGPIPPEVDIEVELLRGLSRELDRHSVVMHEGRLQRFDERIKGRLSGVGSTIGLEDGELVVKEIFPDSPASRGGLQIGDVIVAIDGFSTVGLSVNQAVGRIRGPKDSRIVLTIRRDAAGSSRTLDLAFLRDEVRIPNVTWQHLPSGVGVIAIENFSEQTVSWMEQALTEFARAGRLSGLIIDLRGNTGGSMIQSCRAADLFLSSGTILRTEGRAGRPVQNLRRSYTAQADDHGPLPVPVAILVDNQSASASEILAGSLSLLDRAVLIGERTHGKGTVQMRHSLRAGEDDDRVEMKLTVAEYKLGESAVPIVAGEGLEPDLWVRPVVFSRGGAWLPGDEGGGRRLQYVEERPGWREGAAFEREDYLQELAERVLLSSEGWDRPALLASVDELLPRLRAEEEARLVETFGYRGIDWESADEPGGAPNVRVEVRVVDPPIAGEKVELRAVVENRGRAPIYRLWIELTAEDGGLPWDGVSLPVGFLPPGESALGSAMVSLPAGSPQRVDRVRVTVHADERPAAVLAPVLLAIDVRPAPPMAARARLKPVGAAHAVEVELENLGKMDLEGVRAWLALPDDTAVELLAREATLPGLAAGGRGTVQIGARLPAGQAAPLEAELRVEAEGLGEVLRVPLKLGLQGQQQRVEPPRVSATAPLQAAPGRMSVPMQASDDRRIVSISAWWDREQIAWRTGSGAALAVPLDVVVGYSHHVLTVEAIDDQGARTTRSYHIQSSGTAPGGAVQANTHHASPPPVEADAVESD